MLDFGASHNLIPKEIMEKIRFYITQEYKDLYSFQSRSVRCLGMIKYLVFVHSQVPLKSIVMDVVVADVPTNYGMIIPCVGELN